MQLHENYSFVCEFKITASFCSCYVWVLSSTQKQKKKKKTLKTTFVFWSEKIAVCTLRRDDVFCLLVRFDYFLFVPLSIVKLIPLARVFDIEIDDNKAFCPSDYFHRQWLWGRTLVVSWLQAFYSAKGVSSAIIYYMSTVTYLRNGACDMFFINWMISKWPKLYLKRDPQRNVSIFNFCVNRFYRRKNRSNWSDRLLKQYAPENS